MHLQITQVKTLLEIFSQYNFYILGAGTSYDLIPNYSEIRKEIFSWQKEIGHYSASPFHQDEVTYRIIGSPRKDDDSHSIITYKSIPPSAVHLITSINLSSLKRTDIFEYPIFSLFFKPSVIFNMNVDGLAEKYCGKEHIVLNLHGNAPSEKYINLIKEYISACFKYDLPLDVVHNLFNDLTFDIYFDQIIKYYTSTSIDYIIRYGINVPLPPRLILPMPEPVNITNEYAYKKAEFYFPYINHLILIGYSFGRQLNDSIDDKATFSFFTEGLLYKHPKPIYILDKNPEPIAEMIQKITHLNSVYPIPVYWNHLSRAIIEMAYINKIKKLSKLNMYLSEIFYRYCELYDINS